MHMKILGIVGSTRKGSYNRGLMNAFIEHKPEGVEMEVVEIGTLPLFDQDVEASAFPETAQALKDQIANADAVIIATPEYNRGMPGVLKNAIDWASRPYGKNSFAGKTVYVVGASVGPIATAVSQYNVKQVMLYLDAHVIGQPEFYVGLAGEKFDAEGTLTDASTKEHIVGAWKVIAERAGK